MKVTDLGELTGKVVLFGGPYANLQATRALFKEIADVPVCNRVCTGDLVAYCADPVATTECIRSQTGAIVAGNCEIQLANDADDCGCGFEEGSVCDLASQGWYPFARARMNAYRDWFVELPKIVTFRHAEKRCAVIHGGISDIARFIWPSDSDTVFLEEIKLLEDIVGDIDIVVAGHCGLPFERRVGRYNWINAGVIGMPPHDGKADTRYAILSEDGVRFHTLIYDYSAASEAMRGEGLVNGYAQALINGLWPSEDVLPSELRL